MEAILRFAPTAAFWMLALAAQVSGYSNPSVAAGLAASGALLLLWPGCHYGVRWLKARRNTSGAASEEGFSQAAHPLDGKLWLNLRDYADEVRRKSEGTPLAEVAEANGADRAAVLGFYAGVINEYAELHGVAEPSPRSERIKHKGSDNISFRVNGSQIDSHNPRDGKLIHRFVHIRARDRAATLKKISDIANAHAVINGLIPSTAHEPIEELIPLKDAAQRVYDKVHELSDALVAEVHEKADAEFQGEMLPACAHYLFLKNIAIYGEPLPSTQRRLLPPEAFFATEFSKDANSLVGEGDTPKWVNLVVKESDLRSHLDAIHLKTHEWPPERADSHTRERARAWVNVISTGVLRSKYWASSC